MQCGDVALEVLCLSFQLVQFLDVLLVLNFHFSGLPATTETRYQRSESRQKPPLSSKVITDYSSKIIRTPLTDQ